MEKLKSFISTDTFEIHKKGTVVVIKILDKKDVPVVGEYIFIDNKRERCLEVEVMRCMCGNCSLTAGILTRRKK